MNYKKIKSIQSYFDLLIEKNINLLNKIYAEIAEGYINKNYDLINYRLTQVQQEISLLEDIYVLLEDKRMLNELQLLRNQHTNISNKINKLGYDLRIDILSLLEIIDNNDESIKYIYKKELLNNIYVKLDLENISQEDIISVNFKNDTVGKGSFANISYKQISSYEYCLLHVMDSEINKAIHSLYEFIYNYKLNFNEPFNSYERILIKNMIDIILKLLE